MSIVWFETEALESASAIFALSSDRMDDEDIGGFVWI